MIVSVLTSLGCAPCGLTAAQLSCLHSWPGLGTWAGVFGTSTEISACLGSVCCRQAQGAPRDSSECWLWDRSLPGMRWCLGSGSARKHRPEPAAPLGCAEVKPRGRGARRGRWALCRDPAPFPIPLPLGRCRWAGSSTQRSGKAVPKACPQSLSQAVLAPCGRWQGQSPEACTGLYQHSRHFRCV